VTMRLHHLASVGLLGLALVAFTPSALADIMPYAGTTTGSFSVGTPSTLQFIGTSFGGLTDGSGSAGPFSIGTFSLERPQNGFDHDYSGDLFTLVVDFSLPPGTVESPASVSAVLTGLVKQNPNAAGQTPVSIDFINNSQLFTFNDATQNISGSFTLTIDDILDMEPGPEGEPLSYQLNGSINGAVVSPEATTAPVPEPSAIVLLGTAVSAITIVARRRRSRV
jgi:hypothetical protein